MKKTTTLTLISYNSFLSSDGYVAKVMQPLVLFMSKTPSLPEIQRSTCLGHEAEESEQTNKCPDRCGYR